MFSSKTSIAAQPRSLPSFLEDLFNEFKAVSALSKDTSEHDTMTKDITANDINWKFFLILVQIKV